MSQQSEMPTVDRIVLVAVKHVYLLPRLDREWHGYIWRWLSMDISTRNDHSSPTLVSVWEHLFKLCNLGPVVMIPCQHAICIRMNLPDFQSRSSGWNRLLQISILTTSLACIRHRIQIRVLSLLFMFGCCYWHFLMAGLGCQYPMIKIQAKG